MFKNPSKVITINTLLNIKDSKKKDLNLKKSSSSSSSSETIIDSSVNTPIMAEVVIPKASRATVVKKEKLAIENEKTEIIWIGDVINQRF